MRVFAACLFTETNTFAPLPTGLGSFEEMGLYFGDASIAGRGQAGAIATFVRETVEGAGHELIEGVFAFAQPSGKTLDRTYLALRDRLLADLAAADSVDVVLLWLHGAMVAVSEDDCEGDLLARVRALVGEQVPVGAVLDPHCHLSARMLANADAIICMKEYPHTDGPERTAELLTILTAQKRGEVRPVHALVDTQMIGFYPTTHGPMADFVRLQKEVERRPGILSVSLGHGFPWADVMDVGTKVLVLADKDRGLATRSAHALADALYDMRDALRTHPLDASEAIDRAIRGSGLSVIADAADNAGGGAPSDNTVLLRAMVERRLADAAIGFLYDPQAVAICFEAGIGASFELRIGGKLGPASDQPLDARVTVRALADNVEPNDLGRQPMGRCARIEIGGVQVLLCSRRVQTFSPQPFEALGVDVGRLRVIVVKSSEHFRAAFVGIVDQILYAASGGALDMRFEQIPYTKRDLNYWPRVADPAGLGR